MTKILKLAGCALMLSGYCAHEVSANCPELNQAELRRLCRWEGFKVLGIKAGSIEKNGTTLTNNLGTCGEGDSIKEFVTKKGATMYPGVLTKDFAEPTNPLKGLCTYTVGKEKIAFNVQLPPRPVAEQTKQEEPKPLPQPKRKDPRTFGGVDITTSPQIQKVPIEKHPSLPTTARPEPTHVQAAPDRPGRPIPPQANPTPRPAVRGIPQDVTPVPQGSRPPQYSPPPTPSRAPQRPVPLPPVQATAEQDKPLDMKSELEQRLQKRRELSEGPDGNENTPPRRHPPEPTYGGG